MNESPVDKNPKQSKKDYTVQFQSIHEELKVMVPEITLELQRGISRALVEVTLSDMYLEM